MDNLKIIYISYDGMTDPLGQSQVLPYLIGLSSFNFEIHLISFEKQDKFLNKKQDIELLIKDKSIVWHPLKYHQKPPVLSTLYDLWNLNQKANEIIALNKISIIHCRSYISSLIGLSIKRKKGIPFLFDMRGFWADERIDGKIWNLSNPIFKLIYNYFKRKEREFICESNHIVSLTENAKNEILKWPLNLKINPKIKVIPCCADLDHFSLNKINSSTNKEWQLKIGISDHDFVISYIGSLGTWYLIDEMMDLFKEAQSKVSSCKFLIITADNPEIAFQAARKCGISENSIIVKKAERSEVPYLIALSKFSIFFIKPSYSKKASSPTKLAEILGMGVPVICNNNVGDVESIVEKGKVGFVLKDFNKAEYEKIINKMLDFLPLANHKMISNYANHYASLKDGIKKYYEVYVEILNATHDDKTRL
jgi:glycosyltransferase involved in cell wall biosynthesis